jgi:hypothetical protein
MQFQFLILISFLYSDFVQVFGSQSLVDSFSIFISEETDLMWNEAQSGNYLNLEEFETLANNYFNFEELSYAKSKGISSYKNAPQFLGFVDTVYVQQNETVELTVDDGNYQGASFIYRWMKDGSWVHDASSNHKKLNIDCGTPACQGLYFLQITNPDFVSSHLTGNVFYIKIRSQLNKTICLLDEYLKRLIVSEQKISLLEYLQI